MKVKILIVPLSLVIALALMVWLVYPAYSNMGIQKKALEEKNQQVSDLEQKNQKVSNLMSVLNSNVEKQATLMKYLPDSQKEEEVIASLNGLASGEGISVSSISISAPKVEVMPIETVAATDQSDGEGASQNTESINSSRANVIKFEANFNLYGNYDKIKNIINKIYSLARFNRIIVFSISPSTVVGQEGIVDNFQANLILEFNYLEAEKIGSVVNINNKILSEGKFDMAVIDEVMKNKNTAIYDVRLDSTGKTNPFLP